MKEDHSFTATFLVDQTPEQAYRAVTQVDRWWSQAIEGKAAQVGDVFLYRYQDVHRCAMKVIEADPGRRMVWLVLENEFSFIKDKSEWVNTKVCFDLSREGTQTRVRFTHEGLVQAYECYEVCANAWTSYVTGSLRGLIATGQGQPNVRASADGGPAPKSASFTTSFTVDKDPQVVFDAINNVRAWWGGEIEGAADKLGDEFSYRYNDLHFSTQKVTELVPGKRVVWHVLDATLSFTRNPAEWKGTDICFDIARRGDRTEVVFTHVGLVPEFECFQDCSTGWRFYVNGSLHNFISGAKLAVVRYKGDAYGTEPYRKARGPQGLAGPGVEGTDRSQAVWGVVRRQGRERLRRGQGGGRQADLPGLRTHAVGRRREKDGE